MEPNTNNRYCSASEVLISNIFVVFILVDNCLCLPRLNGNPDIIKRLDPDCTHIREMFSRPQTTNDAKSSEEDTQESPSTDETPSNQPSLINNSNQLASERGTITLYAPSVRNKESKS